MHTVPVEADTDGRAVGVVGALILDLLLRAFFDFEDVGAFIVISMPIPPPFPCIIMPLPPSAATDVKDGL